MGRCLRFLLTAILTLALAASGWGLGSPRQATASTMASGPSILRGMNDGCPSCQASPVVAVPVHCGSICPSLIGTLAAATPLDEIGRILPTPAPAERAVGRTTIPDPTPPRS